MALNFEKLDKLMRQFRQPKFALQEISRQLKKRPNDPYILAWQANETLRSGKSPSETLDQLFQRQPPINDTQLLSLLYSIQISVLIFFGESKQIPASAGPLVLAAWKNASKNIDSKKRSELWHELLRSAVEHDCWEDVVEALVSGSVTKDRTAKAKFFRELIASQLSYEMQARIAKDMKEPLSAKTAMVRRDLTLAKLKRAFESGITIGGQLVRVENQQDLSLMSTVYQRQLKHNELMELWNQAPVPLKPLIEQQHYEALFEMISDLERQRQWSAVISTSLKVIDNALNECERSQNDTSIIYLANNAITVFSGLVEAVWIMGDSLDSETRKQIRSTTEKYTAKCSHLPGSSTRVACMLLAAASSNPEPSMDELSISGESMYSMCITYWRENCNKDACYKELSPFVGLLRAKEHEEFLKEIARPTEDLVPDDEAEKTAMSNLLQCRLHVLRFEFLLVISASQTTPSHVVDDFIVRALQLCRLGIRAKHDAAYEAGFLAIHALVSCTDKVMNNSPIEHALGGDVEQSRMEYQAAFLAQYLTAGTEGKDKRQLILYAARLHNLLGLATISLQLYTEAKIKEMFNATLSHFLYTRISQIHPFDTTSGRNAIYPENDLNETIDKIQRLGIKMSDSILHSLDKQETYASVAGMLTAKRRVRSSLATHLLFVERRRIARLKGETVNESMEPSYESFVDIVDDRDFKTLPNPKHIEMKEGRRSLRKGPDNAPLGYPTVSYLYHFYKERDAICQLVYKETPHPTYQKRIALLAEAVEQTPDQGDGRLPCEKLLDGAWAALGKLAHHFHTQDGLTPEDLPNLQPLLNELINALKDAHGTLKEVSNTITQPNKTTPENSVFPRAEMFIYWYSIIEVLQLCSKMSYSIEDYLKPLKPKSLSPNLKTELTATSKNLLAVTEICFGDLQTHVADWIRFIKEHGAAVLGVWVQSGPTGEALKEVLPQRNLLKPYIDNTLASLLDSLEGVLKARLPR